MSGHTTTPTDLGMLQARVASLEAALARQGRQRRRVFSARWLGAALVLLLALMPAALGADDRFDDVPDDAFYHDDASAIADAGVTLGCGDGSIYCPDDFVTRGEMASFLARLGGLGTNPPVANALTAETVTNVTAPTPTIRTNTATLVAGPPNTLVVNCEAGEVVTGGGYNLTSAGPAFFSVIQDYPSSTTAWTVQAVLPIVPPPPAPTLTVYALCVPAAP